jgi:hypothetical protein
MIRISCVPFVPDGPVILQNFGNSNHEITPFLISPTGEKMDFLLPPWGKVGKGVN